MMMNIVRSCTRFMILIIKMIPRGIIYNINYNLDNFKIYFNILNLCCILNYEQKSLFKLNLSIFIKIINENGELIT